MCKVDKIAKNKTVNTKNQLKKIRATAKNYFIIYAAFFPGNATNDKLMRN